MNTKIIYSDGQQIHQHQQDEQSALISTPTNPPTPTRRTISSHLNSNKSTNINKTNNQLSSQLQQIHQHKTNKDSLNTKIIQSALISTPTNPPTSTRRTISSHLKIIYSDGQQIHQHQQDASHLNSLNTKKTTTFGFGSPGLVWNRHTNVSV